MKNGYIELSDADPLMEIYRKIDINGNLKEPLTVNEQILIFCIAKSIHDIPNSRPAQPSKENGGGTEERRQGDTVPMEKGKGPALKLPDSRAGPRPHDIKGHYL